MAYNRIFYDSFKNRMYCVDITDGKRTTEDFHPEFEYYIEDKTGESEIKDIYGNNVKLMKSETKKDMKMVSEVSKTYETDIPEDSKYLQRKYKNQKLKVEMNDFQIATIDIEIETGSSYKNHHIIKMKDSFGNVTNIDIGGYKKLNKSENKVYDEWKSIWCDFESSCYFSKNEFPNPEEAKYPINLISVHYSKDNTLYTYGNRPYTGDHESVKHYHYCLNEKTLMEEFIKMFRTKRVSIVTGWFSRQFDIPYIINRANKIGVDVSLSPINMYKKKHWRGYHIDESDGYDIAGISLLDGMDLFKNYEREKQASYSLQNIGMLVVGEGKKDYSGTINDAFLENWNEFVEYNIQDVLLVRKIEEKKKFIELTINLSYQALIPFTRVFSSISVVEGYIMKYLHENNMVLHDNERNKLVRNIPGAYCYAKVGYHKNCFSLDAESLYPTIIQQFNIGDETLILDDNRYGKTPFSEYKKWETVDGELEIGGIYYDRSKQSVLSKVTEDIIKGRKIFKQKMFIADAIEHNRPLTKYNKELVAEVKLEGDSSNYYDSMQYVRKILANSIFGCISNQHFHLYNYHNAISITMGGQSLIKYMKDSINSYMLTQFHKVVKNIYPDFNGEFKQLKNEVIIQCDTDSVFLCMDEVIKNFGLIFNNNQEIYDWMNDIEQRFFSKFVDKILQIYADKYGMKQIINFKREKIIIQKLITAKKKYVDQILANEDKLYIDDPKISVTGIEIVRTDTPAFCKSYLKQSVNELFKFKCADKIGMNTYIKDIKEKFIKSDIKDISIPKGVKEYTKYAEDINHYMKNGLSYPSGCPIHVRASINYNYLIKKWNLPLSPIGDGTKLKFIHTLPNNEIHQDVIGFIGDWPVEFNKAFKIDYDRQFERTFSKAFQRFYNVLNWGNITMEDNSLSDFITF